MDKHRSVAAARLLVIATEIASGDAEKEDLESADERRRNFGQRIRTTRDLVRWDDSNKILVLLKEAFAAHVVIARCEQLGESGRERVDEIDKERCLRRGRVLKIRVVRQTLPQRHKALYVVLSRPRFDLRVQPCLISLIVDHEHGCSCEVQLLKQAYQIPQMYAIL